MVLHHSLDYLSTEESLHCITYLYKLQVITFACHFVANLPPYRSASDIGLYQ